MSYIEKKMTLIYAQNHKQFMDYVTKNNLERNRCIRVTDQAHTNGFTKENADVVFLAGWSLNMNFTKATEIFDYMKQIWNYTFSVEEELADISGLRIM